MTLPSRKEQVEKVLDLLEQAEEKTLAELAEIIVDGYLNALTSGIKRPILLPAVGMAFKHPALSGVWHVAYDMDYGQVWIVSATSKYGAVLLEWSEFWKYAEQSTAKAGAPGNNKDGWQVGDKISRRQRQFIYEIVQTSDKGALLKDIGSKTYLQESNENLASYYRREIEMAEIEW